MYSRIEATSLRQPKKGKNVRPSHVLSDTVAHFRAVFVVLIFSLFPNFVSYSSYAAMLGPLWMSSSGTLTI